MFGQCEECSALGVGSIASEPTGAYQKFNDPPTPTTESGCGSPVPWTPCKPRTPSFSSESAHGGTSGVADDDHGALQLVLQVFPPFLVAGLGMVAAGLLLGYVTREFNVFEECREILVLVPALLGLKGNLEMTLASRLSTHANLGDLDCKVRDMIEGDHKSAKIIGGNLMVVQSQAIVVGFLAALVAIIVNITSAGKWNYEHALLLCSSAVASASIASFVLAIIMICIVLCARRTGIDPDNVASPIAGMLGDFCTLALLASIAQTLWSMRDEYWWAQCMILGFYACVAPMCTWLAKKNTFTCGVLREAWAPVIISMFMSSVGGMILKHAVHTFHQLAPFAPVMNGAGGNLAAVYTSRLSTTLHERKRRERSVADVETPSTDAPSSGAGSTAGNSARVLTALIIPGSLCFCIIIVGVQSAWTHVPEFAFLFVFAAAATLQVVLLVSMADVIVAYLWESGVDPDNAAIPFVTALGDVVGATLLTLAFYSMAALEVRPW